MTTKKFEVAIFSTVTVYATSEEEASRFARIITETDTAKVHEVEVGDPEDLTPADEAFIYQLTDEEEPFTGLVH